MAYGGPFIRRMYNRSGVPLQNLLTTIYGYRLKRRKYGRDFWRHFEEVEARQWWSRDQLEAHRRKRVRDFLLHAATHVPHYQRVFAQHRVALADLERMDGLAGLPLLEKEEVSAGRANLISTEFQAAGRTVRASTSGTTGKQLSIRLTHGCFQREYAFRWCQYQWGRIRMGARTAIFQGHPVVPIENRRPPFWRQNFAEAQLYFSTYHMTPDALVHYAAELRAFAPEMILGYPSALSVMAQHLELAGIDDIRPRAVFATSETLLEPQRRRIEAAFGCKVFDWYGNTEMCANIVECEQGSLHVREDHSYVEFVNGRGEPARPGEEGELICTGYGNPAMPLIRYRIGDVATLKEGTCECGRSGRLVERVLGRLDDIVVTPDGRRIGRLDHVFKDIEEVSGAQIVQESLDRLTMRVVRRSGDPKQVARRIEQALRERVGAAMRIEVEFTDQIPVSNRGKVKFVVSKVKG